MRAYSYRSRQSNATIGLVEDLEKDLLSKFVVRDMVIKDLVISLSSVMAKVTVLEAKVLQLEQKYKGSL